MVGERRIAFIFWSISTAISVLLTVAEELLQNPNIEMSAVHNAMT
jgi:hypothetical protein